MLLRDAVARWEWDVDVLCSMPNHSHLVVETSGARLSAGLHRVNGIYAQAFNARYERSGHAFGDRFSARTIASEEHLEATRTYVLNNPVRAGLCATAAEWPWSGSRYGYDAA